MTPWTRQEEEFLMAHFNKLSIKELAIKLGKYQVGIHARYKFIKKLTFPVIDFIASNYKVLPNKEIFEIVTQMFPDVKLELKHIGAVCEVYQYIRTPEDMSVIMNRLVETGVKRKALLTGHITRGTAQDGDIRFKLHSGRWQWVIKQNGLWRKYAKYLWRLHKKETPKNYRAEWIDPQKPLTIDNLHLVKNNVEKFLIGDVTTWLHEGKRREIIKVGSGEYRLLLPYLWRQNYGEIPPGQWVAKIDPNKPTTIENLYLTHDKTIGEGSKNLEDWYIIGLLTKGKDETFKEAIKNDPDRINIKRKLIEASRIIKSIEHGFTSKITTDNQLAAPPTQDEE